MLDKALTWLAKVALGKRVTDGIAWAHDKLDGKRSEVITAVLAAVNVLGWVGVVPPEAVDGVNALLLPLLPVTLADRLSKLKKQADTLTAK